MARTRKQILAPDRGITMRYRELKYRRKHGNSAWKHRPYHDAKGDNSWFDSFLLFYRRWRRISIIRYDRMYSTGFERPDWEEHKNYPKFKKKYFSDFSTEDKVLKKHLWRI